MGIAATRIDSIHLVMIPTTDPDRSIRLYEALGFAKRADAPFGDGERWVELFPPGGSAGIALAPGDGAAGGMQTGIILTTDDIDAAHAELRDHGVDFYDAVARAGAPTEIRIGTADVVGPFPPMFYLRDPDGNALLLVGPG
jgi:catechol 2,3-dioxygenase-like lactoylglutathione lyase family enzyme